MLRFLGELKPEDILLAGSAHNAIRDDLEAIEGRLTNLARRIEKSIPVA